MKRSPLNTSHGNRTYGARHTLYNWKLKRKNANNRGYHSVNNSYQCFSVNNERHTPVTQHERHNTNQYSSANERNSASPGSGWYNNRNNYHVTSRSNCNNRYSTYKHSGNQLHGQKRKGYKRMHRQANISMYIDINSFLEDPWKDLVKKFNSKEISKSETSKNEPLQNSLNESIYSINSNICGIIEVKDNTHSNEFLTDTDQKNI
ncbi:hypothetical protein ACFW04_002079 [Cataglyphis niger]